MSSPQWLFGGFRLDPDNACLWRGAQAIALTPKAFDVLNYLITHPDRLVTTDTLLDAVWPETAISDTVMRIASASCAESWVIRHRPLDSLRQSTGGAIA